MQTTQSVISTTFSATGLLALIVCASGCTRATPPCQKVIGRWQGASIEGVESASPELQAVMRSAIARERWTLSAQQLVREGAVTERVVSATERDGRCVVRLAREAPTSERTLQLEVTSDGAMRAVTPSRDERVPVVVLRRVE